MSQNKDIYKKWIEMWNGNDALIKEIVSPHCIIHQAPTDHSHPLALHGQEGIAEMIKMGHAFFSTMTIAIDVAPITEDTMLAARWKATGSYIGGLPDTAAQEGKEVVFGGIDIMKIDSGKIIEYWVSSDGLYLMAQLNKK